MAMDRFRPTASTRYEDVCRHVYNSYPAPVDRHSDCNRLLYMIYTDLRGVDRLNKVPISLSGDLGVGVRPPGVLEEHGVCFGGKWGEGNLTEVIALPIA